MILPIDLHLHRQRKCVGYRGEEKIVNKNVLKVILLLFVFFLFYLQFSFAATTRNPHGILPVDCIVCHTTDSWNDPSRFQYFNHQKTNFPLTGQHRKIKCVSCHKELHFAGITTECYVCHQDIHKGELGTQCAECHNTVQWQKMTGRFEEHQRSRFPLMGAHLLLDCRSCHPRTEQGEFRGVPLECEGCHLTGYQNTVNPSHRDAGFSRHCQDCHTANTWHDIRFNHAVTGFPLLGPHKTVECQVCHVNSQYRRASLECYECHQNDFAGAKNPDHIQGGFPSTCSLCHTILTWSPATFDHNRTQFILTGTHRSVPCIQCHRNNVFAGTPVNCYDCHGNDYHAARNPNHLKAGFSTTCQECHLTEDWQQHRFPHPAFILLGAHQKITCNECHLNDVFTGIPESCQGCHTLVYNQWPDPDHQKAGFSQNCEECHSQAAWVPTSYNHDSRYFPIYSGAHRGTWKSCSNPCHPDQNRYAEFQCLTCHEHNKAESDEQHKKVPDYQYLSLACFNCHPKGKEN